MTIAKPLTSERPADARICEFVEASKAVLPQDYILFLRNKNGGRPSPNMFQFTERSGKVETANIDHFFALYSGKVGSLEVYSKRMKGRIPVGYLPIATDSFGNLILLGSAHHNLGKIYFWDHEKEEDEPTLKNMSAIANSFTDLIEKLTEV